MVAKHVVHSGMATEIYDLVQILQQKADEAVRYRTFAGDARAAGDDELAAWFEELAANDDAIVARAQELLRARLPV